MPTFAGTTREFQILIAALPGGGGISKRDLELASKLRDGLKKQLGLETEIPKIVKFTPLPNSWPTGMIQPTKKGKWNWSPKKSSNVALNNSTTRKQIDSILDGLV